MRRQEFAPIESKSVLLETLARSPRVLLIGAGVENPCEFYVLDVVDEAGSLMIGLMSSGVTEPEAICSDDGTKLLVGHDEYVSCIAVKQSNIAFVYDGRHLARFTAFAEAIGGSVIIVWDIGVIRLDFDGRVLWEFDAGDVVTRWRMSGSSQQVELELHESPDPLILDLRLGRVVGRCQT